MRDIILAILISVVAYIYFIQKEKYIEVPVIKENLDNVHVFSLENHHD